MKDNGTDRPEGMSVLAPQEHLDDVRAPLTRRRALSLGLGSVASMYLAACGGKSGAATGTAASTTSGLSPSSAIEGNLLMANWADYVDPKDYCPGNRTAHQCWVRIAGKHRNQTAGGNALQNMIATRH